MWMTLCSTRRAALHSTRDDRHGGDEPSVIEPREAGAFDVVVGSGL